MVLASQSKAKRRAQSIQADETQTGSAMVFSLFDVVWWEFTFSSKLMSNHRRGASSLFLSLSFALSLNATDGQSAMVTLNITLSVCKQYALVALHICVRHVYQ